MSDILAIPGIGKVSEGTKVIATGVEAVVTSVDAESGTLTIMAAIPDSADFTEASIEAEEVQQIIGFGEVQTVKTARDFRKEAAKALGSAQRALMGRSGLTEADKAQLLMKARDRVEQAYAALGEALAQIDGDVILSLKSSENFHDPAKPLGA